MGEDETMADNREKIEQMLGDLAAKGFERPRPGLLGQIKDRIPAHLSSHRLDTMHIIVDFRINRLTAAAAIIAVVILAGTIFGGRNVVTDGASVLKYAMGGEEVGRTEILESLAKSYPEFLATQDRDFVYYRNRNASKDPNTILMFWSQDPNAGTYGVIFGDLSTRTVNTETLAELLGTRILAASGVNLETAEGDGAVGPTPVDGSGAVDQ